MFCAIYSGKYTLMSHSVIFVNLSSPVIVAYKMIRKEFVHRLEVIGCAIAIGGSIISIMDHSSQKVNTED